MPGREARPEPRATGSAAVRGGCGRGCWVSGNRDVVVLPGGSTFLLSQVLSLTGTTRLQCLPTGQCWLAATFRHLAITSEPTAGRRSAASGRAGGPGGREFPWLGKR